MSCICVRNTLPGKLIYEEVAEFLKSGMTEEQLAKSTQKRRGRKQKK